MALAAGAPAERISYGNTIKKERGRRAGLCARRAALLRSTARPRSTRSRAARRPARRCFCRFLHDCGGRRMAAVAQIRLRSPQMAVRRAGARPTALGLVAHWGVVPCRLAAAPYPVLGRARLKSAGDHLPRACAERGHQPVDGQFSAAASRPSTSRDVPTVKSYGDVDLPGAAQATSATRSPETIIDAGPRHGRQCRRDRGRRSCWSPRKARPTILRWVYLDIGKFGGLARDHGRVDPLPDFVRRATATMWAACVLAGPTCDSMDVLYEKEPYPLPISLEIGDKVADRGHGRLYGPPTRRSPSMVFPPLKTYHI